MIGLTRLRVRALFPVINEQNKLNATDNVVVADFSRAAARRAAQSLAPHSASHSFQLADSMGQLCKLQCDDSSSHIKFTTKGQSSEKRLWLWFWSSKFPAVVESNNLLHPQRFV